MQIQNAKCKPVMCVTLLGERRGDVHTDAATITRFAF
jgi:hypothetical protein